jgi:hypothetical protein
MRSKSPSRDEELVDMVAEGDEQIADEMERNMPAATRS